MNRETVYQALFDHLKTIPGLKIASRRLRMWNEVDDSDKPALFLAVDDQTPTNDESGLPAVWRLTAEVAIYVHTADPEVPPSSLLNPLLDALETKLQGLYPGRPFTLNGLAVHVWIAGAIETSGDRMGDHGIASIPLEILVNS